MSARLSLIRRISGVLLVLLASAVVHAQESADAAPALSAGFVDRVVDQASASVVSVGQTLEEALGLIGIRYRRGGTSPETGFDCSGFVGHVFREGLGVYLPHNAKQISKTGEVIAKQEMQPGDLVFFNTMRRAFSHVGIYLGDNKFIHSPRTGGSVRVEDMTESYWRKRFDGARRIVTAQ
jgi:cell wall-associated NlpC family hydrolase